MAQVRAILGPTNTGKTHLAVERLLAHDTGMIGLPLRLLAREVYDRMVRAKGERQCALVTGEERIVPDNARYFACTVEAMPVSRDVAFLAVDEVQMAADPDRGHVFTERILNARGRHETMLLGADTMRPVLRALDLDIDAERRERFSRLAYAGPIKITKLPKRSAIVAFSSEEVYAIAELLKRQRGGCAVIMGALSPRTRNAQVELYQSGEVDYVVATDAIGMGLNLDVGHVAFASRTKFDGRNRRRLRADELAQIAGRAGRFRDDGTFGETGDCEPFDEETVERICDHRFEPLDHLNWRNSALDFSSVADLQGSLRRPSPHPVLRRAPEALDEITFSSVAEAEGVRGAVRGGARVARLWDLCTLPDFRKSGPDAHIRLVASLAERLLSPDARLKDEWMFHQIERLDRIEGDIDAIQQRLAAIRTWTYASNRSDWVENAETWRGRTREIEDRLSDALHEKLLQRFVDRRTSVLLRSLHSEDELEAIIGPTGVVTLQGHIVGHLEGLKFVSDARGRNLEGRAVRNAASRALRPVIERRLTALARAADSEIFLRREDACLLHDAAVVARLVPGPSWLSPGIEMIGGEEGSPALRDRALARLAEWVEAETRRRLEPVYQLREALGDVALTGSARGAAFQLVEAGAAVDRRHAEHPLTEEDRRALRGVDVRTGRTAIWQPGLLKPAASDFALLLRAVHDGSGKARRAPATSSFALKDTGWSDLELTTAGYLRLGDRAVRADLAERLAHALSEARKASGTAAFEAPRQLAALVGCPARDFPGVLRSLGLAPAQRDPETGEIIRWKFASRATKRRRQPETAILPSGQFSTLAQLSGALQAQTAPPARHKRKRRA